MEISPIARDLIAVEISDDGARRCFYIGEHDRLKAMHLLRSAIPTLGRDVKLYPLNKAAASALGLRPKEILEWHIGQRIRVHATLDSSLPNGN